MAEEKLKILLAEDSDDHAYLLKFLLEKSGYEVKRLADGDSALKEILEGERPDLLITDIMMPGLSGLDLLLRLKELGRELPSIVLTGKQEEEDVVRGLEYGALDFIRKPFNPNEVVARIRSALKRSR